MQKKGVSEQMFLIIGALVFSAVIAALLFGKTLDLLGLFNTEEKRQETFEKTFDDFVNQIIAFLSDKDNTLSTEIFLGENKIIYFFDKGEKYIETKPVDGTEGSLKLKIERPLECGENRACVCLCEFAEDMPITDFSELKSERTKELSCGEVLSCRNIGFSKIVNHRELLLRTIVLDLTGEGGIRRVPQAPERVIFEKGMFLKQGIGWEYGDRVSMGIFPEHKEIGFVKLEKSRDILGVCSELPCLNEEDKKGELNGRS